MPKYNFKHNETGEVIEEWLRISELDEWKEAHPEYTQVILGAPSMISGTKSALTLAGSGWQDHLKAISKGSGKGNTIKT